jgi:hypothetical protein
LPAIRKYSLPQETLFLLRKVFLYEILLKFRLWMLPARMTLSDGDTARPDDPVGRGCCLPDCVSQAGIPGAAFMQSKTGLIKYTFLRRVKNPATVCVLKKVSISLNCN